MLSFPASAAFTVEHDFAARMASRQMNMSPGTERMVVTFTNNHSTAAGRTEIASASV
jgi:hypothetical protein